MLQNASASGSMACRIAFVKAASLVKDVIGRVTLLSLVFMTRLEPGR